MLTTTYGATVQGHDVEIEFDQRKLFINKVALRLDGKEVDAEHVWYGEKELRAPLPDGGEIEVAIHSGMVGELTRAQVKGPDGTWTDLTERS